jgi:uncharacterized protein (TIGR03067 family)
MRNLGLNPDPWQAEVLESQHQWLLLNCARQAGKSTVVGVLALVEALFTPGTLVLILSRTHRQAKELFRMIKFFHQLLGSKLLERATSDELCLTNLSRIGKRGFFWEAWAKGGADWARVEIPADRIGRIEPEFLEKERRQMGESWYRQEYFCSFEALEGLVYPDFARCVVKAEPPSGRWVGGIDFGLRNPFAAVWGVLDRDNVLWLFGEHYSREKPLSYHVQHLPRNVTWYADPEGAREILELRCAGVVVRKGDNDKRPGIAAVRARIENGTLKLLEGCCPNVLAEAGLYRYDSEADSETPVKEHDHALDALRYLIARIDHRHMARMRKGGPPPPEPDPPLGGDPVPNPPPTPDGGAPAIKPPEPPQRKPLKWLRYFPDGKWSGNTHLFGRPPRRGEWVDLELPIARKGRYRLEVYLTKAQDYGIVQFHLDGKPIGKPIDAFHPNSVVSTGAIELGSFEADEGKARLRIEVVGTNEKSVGLRYMWGLDCVVLRPDEPKAVTSNMLIGLDSEDAARKEYARLEGVWRFALVESDDKKQRDLQFQNSKMILLRDASFAVIQVRGVTRGTLKIDPTTNPKHYERTITNGLAKGRKTLGIYELNGDTLNICSSLRNNERPSELASKPGSGLLFEVFERVKQVQLKEQLIEAGELELARTWQASSCALDGKKTSEEEMKNITLVFVAFGEALPVPFVKPS